MHMLYVENSLLTCAVRKWICVTRWVKQHIVHSPHPDWLPINSFIHNASIRTVVVGGSVILCCCDNTNCNRIKISEHWNQGSIWCVKSFQLHFLMLLHHVVACLLVQKAHTPPSCPLWIIHQKKQQDAVAQMLNTSGAICYSHINILFYCITSRTE